MSKGWTVKVETNVVFRIDTNIGVVASCEREAMQEAVAIIRKEVKKDVHAVDLADLPWDYEIGAFEFTRSGDVYVDDSYIEPVYAEVDPDFDPDPVVKVEEIELATLMETAQCLNEAFYGIDCFHPLYEYRQVHGSAEVRDRINAISLLCEKTYQVVRNRYDFDGPFDFDFCPQFLDKCVDDDFELRSTDPEVLAILWERT